MITSAANPRLRLVRRLQSRSQRARLGLFACEGEDLVAAALDGGLEPVHALVDAERPALLERLPAAEAVEPRLLAELSALGHHPRVLAVFPTGALPRLDPTAAPEVGLALWHVGDPGNLGTLLRCADALGPAFVALSSGCADRAGAKALRASAGAVFRVPVGGFDAAPGRLVALVPHDGEPLRDVDLAGPTTFVLGAEREGLPDAVVARCAARARIPLAPGAESLNVAAAGAIALYERARRGAPAPARLSSAAEATDGKGLT